MSRFKESEICGMLQSCPDENAVRLAKDVALVKSLTKVLNATLELRDVNPKSPMSVATALTKKGLSLSGVAEKASDSSALKAVNFVGTQMVKTVGMAKLATMTPGKASVYLTLAMTEKIVSAAGMANVDKCKIALASLTASTGSAGMVCWATGAFTMGISCAMGAVAIAFDAFESYDQCIGASSKTAARP